MRTPDILACSVRGCHQPLTRHGSAYSCDRGHTFDIARSGYLNLLQPQDRRSRAPGDAAAALDARARLLAAGIGTTIMTGLVERAAAALGAQTEAVALDLGCGTGEALERVAATAGVGGIGIDISVHAIERAARRASALTWLVANADRRLPVQDASAHLILSLNARRNPEECARVLVRGARLLVAVPAPNDLIELRTLVQGVGTERDRADAVVEEHAPFFDLTARARLAERHTLDAAALGDLLAGTYRSARGRSVPMNVVDSGLELTLASDVLSFSRRD